MRIITLTVLLLSTLYLRAEDVKTDIKHVMVYHQGAMVERSGEIRINKGENTIYLTNLSTTLNPGSIRITIENEDITIVSINHEMSFGNDRKIEKECAKLTARSNQLRDSLTWLNTQNEVLGNEKALVLENKKMGGDKGVTATDLAAMTQFFRKELTELENKMLKNGKQMEIYKKEILNLMQKIQNMQKESHPLLSRVKIVLSSNAAYPAVPVKVSYMVNDASWKPFYEVRIKETDQPLQLVYSAKVTQNSQEDWNNVKLTLSTGDPSIDNVRPAFYPMYLPPVKHYQNNIAQTNDATEGMVQGYVRDENGEVLIGATVTPKGSQVGCITNFDGYFSLKMPKFSTILDISFFGFIPQSLRADKYMNITLKEDPNAIAMQEIAIIGYGKNSNADKRKNLKVQSNGTMDNITATEEVSENVMFSAALPMQIEQSSSATEFYIELPYSIPSDEKNYDVKMLEYNIPAEYLYSAVPRHSKEIFLMAYIPNWRQFSLLEGNASLYLKNIYQGESYIIPDATKDTLALSIGRDKDIAVNREEVRNYTSQSLIGSTRKVQKYWDITVRNDKDIAVEIEVEDQYPVSQRDNIKVTLLEAKDAKVDATTGKLTWKIKLMPHSKQTVRFGYEVKYPNSYPFIVE